MDLTPKSDTNSVHKDNVSTDNLILQQFYVLESSTYVLS